MKRKVLTIVSFITLMSFIHLDAQWAKTYGGSEADFLKSAQQTSDGGFVAVGWTSSFAVAVEDIWILKFNPFGNVEWQYRYGGDDWDDGNDIQQTSDGGYIVAGQTQSFGAGENDGVVLKIDPNGEPEWAKAYEGSSFDFAQVIQQTHERDYIIGGVTSSFGEGDTDFLVFKISSDGNIDQSCGPSGFIIAATNTPYTIPSISSLATNALPVDTSVVYHSTNISPQETDIEGNQICAKTKKGSGIR